MTTRILRGVALGALALGMVTMTAACSGGATETAASGASAGSSGSAGSTGSVGGQASGGGQYEGTRESVSVASFLLPKGPTWQATPKTTQDDVEEAFWTAVDAKTGKNICRLSLTVQRPFPNDKESYKILLQGTGESFKGTDDDPQAPQGGWGLIARYAGGAGASPFTSLIRTWVTPGLTKMTVGVTVIDGQRAVCDPQQIVDSLQWDGHEAPTPGSSA